jgi:hypothetical protein
MNSRYGYNKYAEIHQELVKKRGKEKVLGKLLDGDYECDVVSCRGVGQGKYELTLRHGQHIHSSLVSGEVRKLLVWATGFPRPDGGRAIITLTSGKVTAVGPINKEEETA